MSFFDSLQPVVVVVDTSPSLALVQALTERVQVFSSLIGLDGGSLTTSQDTNGSLTIDGGSLT
jgi:hypothetical protein